MPKTPEAPLLDKASLIERLDRRFQNGFKTLSDIPDPSLLLNIDVAAERIARAVRGGERIVLVGDYDVDGVVSTAIVTEFFRQIPFPIETIIPNRFEDGYGVSPSVLERIEADLIVTVDNGIAALEAAQICRARGIDLIITDHHTPGERLPDALCIVNPKLPDCDYPYKEICGAQVAWLVLGMVKKTLGLDTDMGQFLDLLALAIVADVMPLRHINRALVCSGLKRMSASRRPCFSVVREHLGRERLSSEDIAFQIAPRLNSAGRMEDASIALAFLLAATPGEAWKRFETLDALNALRKETEAQTADEAAQTIDDSHRILVAAGEGWHEGVVGIVAARLMQRFERPAIVLSLEGDRAKGSARSLGGVDIFRLISQQRHLLDKFGGHPMAAGLSMSRSNVAAFAEALNDEAAHLPEDAFEPTEALMGELRPDALDFGLLELLERYEPFGEGNPRPRFLIRNARVLGVATFGREHDHSRLTLEIAPGTSVELTAFRHTFDLRRGDPFSCSYTLTKNEFNGRVSMQLLLEKIYPV